MRFVDLRLRAAALFSLVLTALSGCSTLTGQMPERNVSTSVPAPLPAAPPLAKSSPPVNSSAQRAFDAARRALLAGHPDDAERGFRALVKSNPELGGPHANLGLIYRQAGKLKESASELEQAARLSPSQPAYFNQLGITYRHQGRFGQARRAYESALSLDPSSPSATLNLGILCDLYLRDSQCALAQYDRYLALTPGGDATVAKWIADLKNQTRQQALPGKKEKQ
jgi:tetratricopeptide (TPR) repeat protein